MERVHVRVPMAYVDQIRERFDQRTLLEDVRKRLENLGCRNVLSVMQDPSDNTCMTALACSSAQGTDGIVRIARSERTEDLPRSFPAIRCDRELDPGLSEDERRAVHVALAREDNPRHLEGFATTLDPWFPVAASHLSAKRKALDVYEPPSPYGHPPAIDPHEVTSARTRFLAMVQRRRVSLDLAQDEVRRIACFLALEPPPEQVRTHLRTSRIPREALDLAMTTLRRGDDGYPVVDAGAMRLACPPTGEEGFVSPSALQLALAAGKPEMSRVRSRDEARGVLRDLEKGRGDSYATLRAKAAMERAMRALERARWVEWYRKQLTS